MMSSQTHLVPSSWVMRQSLFWPKDGRVLDLASGRGRHSLVLAERFHVLAVDCDADALTPLAAHPQIDICICDLESDAAWPFASKKFDAVLVTNYLFRPKLAALFDLVADGGYLTYETFAVGNAAFGRPKNPDFLLHEGELSAAMPAGFEILDAFQGVISDPQPAVIQRLSARRINPSQQISKPTV
jgi:SAM-dependent methyltransferase